MTETKRLADELEAQTYTAILRDAEVQDWGGVFRVSGAIYGDRAGRWPDGTHVTTSAVTKRPGADNLMRTRNSVYLIEGSLKRASMLPARLALSQGGGE